MAAETTTMEVPFSSERKNPAVYSRLTSIAVLAIVYWGLGKIGLTLAFVNESVSAVWPPTGFALAAVLLLGNRVWPGILIGALLVNVTTSGSFLPSIGIAVGNTLEAVIGAWLVNRFANGREVFEQANTIFKYIGMVAIGSTLVSATIGVMSLTVGGRVPWDGCFPVWLTWWLGDMVSDLLVAPLIVLWATGPQRRWDLHRMTEAAMILTMTGLVSLLAFGGPFTAAFSRYPRLLLFPVLLWAAYRFGPRGAVSTAMVVAFIAIWGTLQGFGPFAIAADHNEALLLLQTFVGTLTVTGLVLGGVVSERRRTDEALRGKEAELRVITESTPLMLTRCSRDLRYLYVNHAYAEMLGRTLEQITGKSIVEIMGRKGFEVIRPRVEKVLQGQPTEYEDEVNFAGVGPRWLRASYNPDRDENGQVVGWIASISDITDRKQAEKEVHASAQRQRLLSELGRVSSIHRDLSGLLEAATRLVGEYFKVSRCGYNRIEFEANRATIEFDYHQGLPSLSGVITISEYDRYWVEEALEGRTAVVGDTKNDVRTATLFEQRYSPIGVQSYVHVPLLRDGKWVASFWVSHHEPRVWTEAEVSFLSSVAERIWLAVENARYDEALSESEARFRTMADAAPVLIWVSGTDKLCNYFNKRWLEFTGRSMEQEVGNGWAEGVHPDDLQHCMEVYIESFDARRDFQMEYRLKRHDGKYRWILDYGIPRFAPSREFLGYIGSCVDITERKQSEQALRENRARLEGLIDSAMDAVLVVDSQQRIVLFNPAAETMFGCPAAKALGSSLDRFIPTRFRKAHREHVENFGQTGATARRMGALGALSGLRDNGEEFPIEASISHMEVGTEKMFTVILRDITERKRAEAELQTWQRELESRVEQRTMELSLANKQIKTEVEERKRLETEIARASEREQLRLGQELHDGLGQELAGIGFMLSAQQMKLEKVSPSDAAETKRLQEMIMQCVDQVRTLAKGFYPVELEKHGLLTALKDLARKTEQTFPIACIVQSDAASSSSITGTPAIQLFRIAQEAVHNAIKHARAKQIVIRLSQSNGRTDLTIQDDGVGLPLEVDQAQGMGLRIMRYRTHMIGGKLDFLNGSPRGAVVACSVPNGGLRIPDVPTDPTSNNKGQLAVSEGVGTQ